MNIYIATLDLQINNFNSCPLCTVELNQLHLKEVAFSISQSASGSSISSTSDACACGGSTLVFVLGSKRATVWALAAVGFAYTEMAADWAATSSSWRIAAEEVRR
ncbi:hypothetical protein TYRP_000179 [Tyrophagus putrescentiae]|nr:hypothetical protein TYRP_000179 [Tyrophagus putrescentiae]